MLVIVLDVMCTAVERNKNSSFSSRSLHSGSGREEISKYVCVSDGKKYDGKNEARQNGVWVLGESGGVREADMIL